MHTANVNPTPVVPDHELLHRIGAGAYGEVWLARNVLGAHRAVKVVYRSSFREERAYEREFRGIQSYEPISRSNEGLLDILQAGRNDAAGYYYYVMELADAASAERGIPNAELAEATDDSIPHSEFRAPHSYAPRTLQTELKQRGRLPAGECVQLGLHLTLALGHLHRRGLIHRDIKPANIIFVGGIPKLADIGLVTAFDDTCSFVGTEGFVPPEGPTSPRADIFSLGKVLYEISTGKDRKDFPEPMTGFGEETDEVLDELNAVILKACAPEPQERYQTAEELHADLALLQSGRSVKNRQRLERRVALLTRVAVVIAVAACVALGAYAFQRYQTAEARRLAEENRRLAEAEANQRQRAEGTLQHLEFQRAHEQFEKGQSSLALAYLARALRGDPSNRIAAERLLSALTHRQYALPKFELAHESKPVSARFSPDGTRVVTAARDGRARVWETATGKLLLELGPERELARAHFSGTARWILTRTRNGTVQVWDASSGQPAAPAISHPGVSAAEFSPDDSRVVTGGTDGLLRIWDAGTGGLLGNPLETGGRVSQLKFSPDGSRLATASSSSVQVWDVAATKRISELPGGNTLDFSPDGRRLVLGSGLRARVWDAETGQPISRSLPHKFPIQSARFSPDGRRVVTASNDQTAQIWDAESGAPIGPPLEHGDGVLYAAFTANGESLFTLSSDRQVRFWSAGTGELVAEPLLVEMERRIAGAAAQLSPDERWLLLFTGSAVRLWDVRRGAMLPLTIQPEIDFELLHDNFVQIARFDAQGEKIVTANSRRISSPWWTRASFRGPSITRVWQAATGRPVSSLVRHDESISACAFSSDGRWIVSASEDGVAVVWNAESGEPRIPPIPHPAGLISACLNRDGSLVATACKDGWVRLWNAESGQLLRQFAQTNDAALAGTLVQPRFVRFSPGDSLLIVCFGNDPPDERGTEPGTRIWNLSAGTGPAVLPHQSRVLYAAFSPDGRRVVTTQSSAEGARVWDAKSGQPLTDWLRHGDAVAFAEFSSDGKRVVTASTDRSARIWDSGTGRLLAGPLKHGWEVLTARFSPDGRSIVTASWDQTAQIWDATTGLPTSEPIRHSDWVHAAEFSPDGNRILTAMVRQSAQVWEVTPLSLPAPDWLPRLAEAIGGQRLDDDGNLQNIAWEETTKLCAELRLVSPTTPLTQWLRWFLADREMRPISASASVSVAEWLERRVEEDSLESLAEALRLAPLNPKILSRLGRKLMIAYSTRVSHQDRAEWLTRLALKLDPDDASVWWLRADVLESLDQLAESREALDKALELAPHDPNAWYLKALLLQRAGETEAGYETYAKALDLVNEGGAARSSAPRIYLQEGLREIREAGELDFMKCSDLAERRRSRPSERNRIERDWLHRKAQALRQPR